MAQGLEGNLEEKVLCLLCWSNEFASSAVLDVTTILFTTKHYRTVAKAAIEYITKYSAAPGHHLTDMLERDIERGDDGKLIWDTICRLEVISQDMNYEFVLDQLTEWVTNRRFDKALETARDLVNKGKREEAEEIVNGYNAGSFSTSTPGLWSHEGTFLAGMDQEDDDEFHLGIEALDNRGIRPARKTLMIVIAPKKRGKSMMLINIAKEAAFVDRKNVLYVTLEMSEYQIAKRITQSICGWTSSDANDKMLRVPFFKRDPNGQYLGMDFRNLEPEAALTHHTRRRALNALQASSRGQPRLLIKEFPTRSLTTTQLVMFLERLRRREKFVPDLLIVDYANEMNMNAANIRTETGRIFRDLRGIAGSRNMAVVTATQGNRASDSAKVVGASHVAEDWSSVGTADIVLTICRTPEEKTKRLARIFVAAARNVGDQYQVMISQTYETCQFAVDSIYMSKVCEHDLDQIIGGDEDDE